MVNNHIIFLHDTSRLRIADDCDTVSIPRDVGLWQTKIEDAIAGDNVAIHINSVGLGMGSALLAISCISPKWPEVSEVEEGRELGLFLTLRTMKRLRQALDATIAAMELDGSEDAK